VFRTNCLYYIKENSTKMITDGMTVTVNYTGKIEDGQVFDTTQGRDPFTFILGVDPLIEGFQEAIVGRQIGASFTVNIPVEKAYGPVMNEKIVSIPKSEMPGEVEVDQILVAKAANEQEARIIVKEVHEEHVVIDGNHPLAGKDLIFEIEIVNAI
jgi:FKBP-type peptidyl-prolyl cis-trans isomerase 2